MFKAARNHLVENDAIGDGIAPSYFIECLLYNVPSTTTLSILDKDHSLSAYWGHG
jgi:hypothetical protein